MAAKKQTPPPIDRPLSKAYLRQFSGWSTAYPPGQSEPNSVRIMENMMVDRNGALAVRPGLRYLSYTSAPDFDPVLPTSPGTAIEETPIGGQELFYTNDGSRALLFAVRETNSKIGFRALLLTGADKVVYRLTDPEIGFTIPGGEDALNFPTTTLHVQYLQIDNKIFALSDDIETARVFFVGNQKLAKKLKTVSVPDWEDTHKLAVVHPDAAWIDLRTKNMRTNVLLNPSFEIGTKHWTASARTGWTTVKKAGGSGQSVLELKSLPARTNMQIQPLHDPANTGLAGWTPDPQIGNPTIAVEGSYMAIKSTVKGLSMVHGSRLFDGAVGNKLYRVSLDYVAATTATPIVQVSFFSANGVEIGIPTVITLDRSSGRYISPSITSPAGTTAIRLSLGSNADSATLATTGFAKILVCPEGEPTGFFHGGSGTNYFWTGLVNQSVSVYHPPTNIEVYSSIRPIKTGGSLYASMKILPSTAVTAYELSIRPYDKFGVSNSFFASSPGSTSTTANTTPTVRIAAVAGNRVSADVRMRFYSVARGTTLWVDEALLEPLHVVGTDTYFDGSVPSTSSLINSWQNVDMDHETNSLQTVLETVRPPLSAETPTANTLIATGTEEDNPYKMAFFYAFENEIGESAPSKITEVRLHRAWSQWLWQRPDATGEPKGGDTVNDELCADQLVCTIPQIVYDQAIAEGAIRWNLYSMSWSDQDPVPPVAQLIGQRDLYPDQFVNTGSALPYEEGGRYVVTPSRKAYFDDTLLPNVRNRVNYSVPPRSSAGMVAGDRLILVGAPDDPAVVQWSSNRPGEYTNFTSSKGGGVKTLTSGNINLPAGVVLWQNPQSVNTITILCMGDNGVATSYYMAPAKTESSSAGTTPVMGFEETTSTPGTTSPYGAEVLNNALYRPLDRSLLKSTASNYNISHKPMSDSIANMWSALRSKQWIMSAQLDNRLYYLVHNPLGEVLAQDCKGNEIWVYDVTAEKGTWSRFLIQGASLKPFKVGTATYIGVACPDGIYYLDPDARLDDYVAPDGLVYQRPIPWRMETNTQGANRAHDAWAHLQQVGVVLGNFKGTLEYGLRGQTVNGKQIDVSKIVSDDPLITTEEVVWDIEDALLVRRDLKEWFFYAHSLPNKESSGLIGYVQYRYTPVTVNVGYEYGSIETFEYGRDARGEGGTNTLDGIPVPMPDRTRP